MPKHQEDIKNQSWGGRFSEATDAFCRSFTASVSFDQRLYRHDIQGSAGPCTNAGKGWCPD